MNPSADPMDMPLDAFWLAQEHVYRLQREAKGRGPSDAEKAAGRRKDAHYRARHSVNGPWW